MTRLFRCLLLSAASLILGALSLPAQTACTQQTTCTSGRTIKCCGTTPCSAVPGSSVTCTTTTFTCSAVDSQFATYNSCRNGCTTAYNNCSSHCHDRTCLGNCLDQRSFCQTLCGPIPPTTFGC
jgi:hypothetical protein